MEKFKLTSESGKEFILELEMAGNNGIVTLLNAKEITPEPGIKIPGWLCSCIEPGNKYFFYATRKDGDKIYGKYFNGKESEKEIHCAYTDHLKSFNDVELEAHLKKMCEKYVGKRVRCLENGKIGIPFEWQAYYCSDDEFWMNCFEIVGACVYKKGKFAEILPDKKKKPETREEQTALLRDWLNDDNNGFVFTDDNKEEWDEHISEFLDQYDI